MFPCKIVTDWDLKVVACCEPIVELERINQSEASIVLQYKIIKQCVFSFLFCIKHVRVSSILVNNTPLVLLSAIIITKYWNILEYFMSAQTILSEGPK